MKWSWTKNKIAIEPQGAMVFGGTKKRLAERLLAEPEESRGAIYAVSARDCLIIFGDNAWLPWVPNINYICRSTEIPDLWLPTVSMPDISHSLLLQKIQHEFGKTSALIWPDPTLIIPLHRQYLLSQEHLQGIINN